jgi:Brp/Blh family beta-carotene 15,15'-monooxygenase
MTAPVAPLPVRLRGRGAGPAAAAPAAGPAPDRRALHLRVRRVGTAAVLALLAASVVAPGVVASWAPLVAVGGVLLGLPHGAVDHLVPGWAAARPLGRRPMALLLTGYLLVVATGAAALRVAPVPTLVVFLAVSAGHFGRGEVVEAAQAAGRPVPAVSGDLVPALAHGLVIVGLPVAAWPAVSLPLLDLLAPGAAASPAWVPTVVGAAAALAVVAALGELVVRRRAGEAGELALLAVTFWAVHPFAAFGVYFGLWHSLRHGARLVDLAAGEAPLRLGLRRVALQAVLPTAGAVAFLVVVASTVRLAPAGAASGLLAAELATLVGLTFPHAVVVAGLDRRLAGRSGAGG